MQIIKFLFIFLIVQVYSQSYHLMGEVSDFNQKPIYNAGVYLIKKSDSSVINFVKTNEKGLFSLKISKQNEEVLLNIVADQFMGFSKALKTVDKDLHFGIISLEKENAKTIDGVNLTSTPVKIKKDTIEYSVAHLKPKPDDKLEDLLKQLPGAEIDDDGNIVAVDGKPINKILVNGKSILGKDGKFPLKNLDASMIKKILTYTSSTKQERLSGKTPISDSITINFKGVGTKFNINAGYGSNERYNANVQLVKLREQGNFVLSGGSNNINVQSLYFGNTFSNSNIANARRDGITHYSGLGFNFSEKINDQIDIDNLSAVYNNSSTETYHKSDKTTFLPSYNLRNFSEQKSNRDNISSKLSANVEFKIDSLSYFTVSFNYNQNKLKSYSETEASSLRDEALINSNSGSVRSENNYDSFAPTFSYFKKFRKKNRSFIATIENIFSENKGDNYQFQETFFAQSPEKNEIRNQRSQNKNLRNYFGAKLEFVEPITDSSRISIIANFDFRNINNNILVNDFDETTQEFSKYNELLSNQLQQKNVFLRPEVLYQLNQKKYNFSFGFDVDFTKLDFTSLYSGQNYSLLKNYTLPGYSLVYDYKISKTKSFRIENRANFTAPSVNSLNPFVDLSNPLVTVQGNPNLKSAWINVTRMNYRSSNYTKNTTFNTGFGFNYRDNVIVNYSYYDDLGKQYKTYTNLSGDKTLSFNISYSKKYKWEKNSLRIAPNFLANYNYKKAFSNELLFTNNYYSLRPRLNLELDLKDKMNIKTYYSFSFSTSQYTDYRISKTEASAHSVNVLLSNYFFNQNLYFENNFNYNRNNNITSGFGKDSFFWASSVTYRFNKDQMRLKLSAYDLLNQRQNAMRNIGDDYIEDTEDLILRRYFMLSFIWNFKTNN